MKGRTRGRRKKKTQKNGKQEIQRKNGGEKEN